MKKAINASVLGLQGLTLSDAEREFFKKYNPYGFILFARNCESKAQIKALTASLRASVGREDAPILIDQEGGRVARLKPPVWRSVPAARYFAEVAERDLSLAKELVYTNSRLIAAELDELGVDVDCTPVLDLLIDGAHDIVGDRAYGKTPERVAALAEEVCRGMYEGGVLPIIKHIPGHGRAKVDSHEDLPVVDVDLATLRATDFEPFRLLNNAAWAMTAHIVYTAIDKTRPATLSPEVIRVIREEIGFDGVLISDDLSMKALGGDFESRASGAIAAGCDLTLHCNGVMEEMQAVVKGTPALSSEAIRRIKIADAKRNKQAPLDFAKADAWIAGALPLKKEVV
jgi:beta-N-acetylhexosaminidase